jgi:hypothetical protein
MDILAIIVFLLLYIVAIVFGLRIILEKNGGCDLMLDINQQDVKLSFCFRSMAHAQDLDIGLAIEIQGPDGVEIIHRGAKQTGMRGGWNQPGMEPVMEIMQENPELAGHA